jgi:hypothetical protein
MNDLMAAKWEQVRAALADADSIAWDGCHKIYVTMDARQSGEMAAIGYDPLLKVDDADDALDTLQDWYARSCGLRFIQAIKTVPVTSDTNERFTDLIGQFDEDDDEGEES